MLPRYRAPIEGSWYIDSMGSVLNYHSRDGGPVSRTLAALRAGAKVTSTLLFDARGVVG